MTAGRLLLMLAAAAALTVLGAPSAIAAGSDAPPPFMVDANGVTLPGGVVFVDGGHVNIRTAEGRGYGIHFEALNNQPSGEWVGASFLPWSAFGLDPAAACVSWVQVAGFNEHFGEGGQPPVGAGCALAPSPSPTSAPPQTPTPSVSPSPTPTATVPPTPRPQPEETEGAGTPVPLPSVYPTPAPRITALPVPEQTSTPRTLAATGGSDATVLILLGLGVVAVAGGLMIRKAGVR